MESSRASSGSRSFEDKLRVFFRWSLIAKAASSSIEIAGGVAAYFVTQRFLVGLATSIFHEELLEDPHDAIANFLVQSAHQYTTGAKYFAAAYLITHGVVKLWLIIGLLRQRLWYYPTSMAVFGLFLVYQIYRIGIHASVWLIGLSVLDVVILWLTWHEYRLMKRALGQSA